MHGSLDVPDSVGDGRCRVSFFVNGGPDYL